MLTGIEEHRPLVFKNSLCAGIVYLEQLTFTDKVGPTFVATNITVKNVLSSNGDYEKKQLQQLKNYC
jgi:hypothetical protein